MCFSAPIVPKTVRRLRPERAPARVRSVYTGPGHLQDALQR
jgi:hypothetical protein